VSDRPGIALGVLAGGAGRRVQGRDKGWIEVAGVPAVVALVGGLGGRVDTVLVSANRNSDRYRTLGTVVADAPARGPGSGEPYPGPMAGVAALLCSCPQPLLLTVPVDVEGMPADVVDRMLFGLDSNCDAAVAVDDDAMQPLVALYRAVLAEPARAAFALGQRSVRGWQQGLRVAPVRFAGVRFGNRNTPADWERDG
jgi:molybdopterin-guanine dinucleotide biosynthesis protein A